MAFSLLSEVLWESWMPVWFGLCLNLPSSAVDIVHPTVQRRCWVKPASMSETDSVKHWWAGRNEESLLLPQLFYMEVTPDLSITWSSQVRWLIFFFFHPGHQSLTPSSVSQPLHLAAERELSFTASSWPVPALSPGWKHPSGWVTHAMPQVRLPGTAMLIALGCHRGTFTLMAPFLRILLPGSLMANYYNWLKFKPHVTKVKP